MWERLLSIKLSGMIVIASLALLACGSSGNSESDSSGATDPQQKQFAAPTEVPSDAQQGGELTVIAASDVD